MDARSPYRTGKDVDAVIAPDRRRRNALLLILVGVIAGAAALESGRFVLAWREKAAARESHPTAGGHITKVTLSGPDGDQVIPSMHGVTVLHVWLQGCLDCMPAFEAIRDEGPCDARVVNVAYGEADPTWAGTYGVRTNLVYDRNGAGLVRPLGISSFTTLVVSSTGEILHRDRPDQIGYHTRMKPWCGDHLRYRR